MLLKSLGVSFLRRLFLLQCAAAGSPGSDWWPRGGRQPLTLSPALSSSPPNHEVASNNMSQAHSAS